MIWSTLTWERVNTLRFPSSASSFGWRDLAFSHDGHLLAAGNEAGDVTVWDMESGATLMHWTNRVASFVFAMTFSPDDTKLVAVNSAQEVRVWNTSNWSDSILLPGHSTEVWQADFTPDGSRLLTGDKDGIVKMWDPSRRPLATIQPLPRAGAGWLSQDGTQLHGITRDATNWVVSVRDLASDTWKSTNNISTVGVVASQISPNGKLLARITQAGELLLDEILERKQASITFEGADKIRELIFQCDSKALWTRQADGQMVLWSCPDLKKMRAISMPLRPAFALPDVLIEVNPSKPDALLPETMRRFSALNGEELAPMAKHTAKVRHGMLTRDGRWFVSAGDDGLICLWSLPKGELAWSQATQTSGAGAVAITPDIRTLAVCSQAARTISIWHIPTHRQVVLLHAPSGISSLRFTDNGNVLYANFTDARTGQRAVRLWRGAR